MKLSNLQYSVSLKLVVVGILVLVLLIPSLMVRNLVSERQERSQEATWEVGQKWGLQQAVAGPVLTIPFDKQSGTTPNGTAIMEVHHAHFLPEALAIEGDLEPETLRRGIYEIPTYRANLKLAGSFAPPDLAELGIDPGSARWSEATVSVAISDPRGLEEEPVLQWEGESLATEPGTVADIISASQSGQPFDPYRERMVLPKPMITSAAPGTKSPGFMAAVPLSAGGESLLPFSLDLSLKGSEGLRLVPVGKTTTAALASAWPAPSFSGSFLPAERAVAEDGFTADWKVLEFNRNFPSVWIGAANAAPEGASFGVDLILPVDHYQKNMRLAKYAVMLIVLTFLAYFFMETFAKKRVHPFHYLLAGFALVLFFVLLLAISEHMPFGWAYLVAAGATIGMITLYSRAIFASSRVAFLEAGILIIAYGFMYTIIQLEDYALLVGSIGLFIALAIVMFISRKIDWYALGNKPQDQ